MALTKEQISILKKQLFEQVKHLPANQRKEAEEQIEDLSDSALEEMLQNQKESQIKVFREIISGKLTSKKVGENNVAIAVLDIKPVSKGHTIIIPKNPVEKTDNIPKEVSVFAEEIAKKLSDKLGVKSIKVIPELKFNEAIINLIPIYDKEVSLESERLNESEEDLNNTLEKINKKEEKVEVKKEEKKELKKVPRRIP